MLKFTAWSSPVHSLVSIQSIYAMGPALRKIQEKGSTRNDSLVNLYLSALLDIQK